MIISRHAKDAMNEHGISESEIIQCIQYGELDHRQMVDNETRYVKKLSLKDKTIMVVYVFRNNEERIITTYLFRRRKQWK